MRDITVCLAYYENPTMLQRQYTMFRTLPGKLKTNVELIVVDDGSPKHPAVVPNPSLSSDGFVFGGFRLFRMKEDIPWNQDACRNLAAHKANTSWLLLTDMDHLIPHKTLDLAINNSDLDPDIAYQFLRLSEPNLDYYKPHPNSWLMSRDLYWRAGGYDERFARSFGKTWGIYGTDGRFKKQIEEIAKIKTFKCPLIRVPREVTPDASTTHYERRSEEMEAKRARVRELIKNSDSRQPAVLTCEWEQVV